MRAFSEAHIDVLLLGYRVGFLVTNVDQRLNKMFFFEESEGTNYSMTSFNSKFNQLSDFRDSLLPSLQTTFAFDDNTTLNAQHPPVRNASGCHSMDSV